MLFGLFDSQKRIAFCQPTLHNTLPEPVTVHGRPLTWGSPKLACTLVRCALVVDCGGLGDARGLTPLCGTVRRKSEHCASKDRSSLHSRTDAYAVQRHINSGIRPERRRNPAALSRSRRNGVLASQRPIARIAASGSAKLWLLTCDRRHRHAISAEYARFPPPRERQAPIAQLATKHRDPSEIGGSRAAKPCRRAVVIY